jgi:Holliday junction resolvase RusA-like endonuclease
MMPPISFFVPGQPKGQPRPRAFARKIGNKFVARVFEAGTAESWKSSVAGAAVLHRLPVSMVGPVRVALTFVFPRPKKHFKANNPAKGLRDDAPHFQISKPDVDNLEKAVLDAITQLGGFWKDDSQVASIHTRKTYGETPGCMVVIRELTEDVAVLEGNAA